MNWNLHFIFFAAGKEYFLSKTVAMCGAVSTRRFETCRMEGFKFVVIYYSLLQALTIVQLILG
jgi:hypothetical protein